jgi:hypothetical protein
VSAFAPPGSIGRCCGVSKPRFCLQTRLNEECERSFDTPQHKYDPAANRAIRARDRVCARDAIAKRECGRALWPSEITPIRDQRCAGWSQMVSTVVSSVGSRVGTPTWMSTGGGASTGTAAPGGGSKGEGVPRTGWRFVRHLNRLSALAFLRPVRKVSRGAEFPIPFRESILRPGLPTPLPRAGRAEHTEDAERRLGSPIRAARKERDFRSWASAGRRSAYACRARKVCFALRDYDRTWGVPDMRFRLDTSSFGGGGRRSSAPLPAISC